MFRSKMFGLILLAVVGMAGSVEAQRAAAAPGAGGGPTGGFDHRRMMAISVLPAPGGLFEVRPVFRVSAPEASAPLDLSTEADVLVNGVVVDTLPFRISAGSTLAGCGTNCAEQGKTCVCFEGTSLCGCGELLFWRAASPQPLLPGDEIMVILRPAPGAVPDGAVPDDAMPDDAMPDDAMRLSFSGSAVFWDRSIGSVVARPAPRGGLYDVEVSIDVRARYEGDLDVRADVELLVNGRPASHQSAADHSASDTIGINPCQGGCASYCAYDSDHLPVGVCEIDSEENFSCSCFVYGYSSVVFRAVRLRPEDEIMVLLRPAPGALPELPGLEDDDREPVRPEREPRRNWVTYDCNGDGSFDITDAICHLSALFAGGEPTPCEAAMDYNGDETVNIADPVAALSFLFSGGAAPSGGPGCQLYPSCPASGHCS